MTIETMTTPTTSTISAPRAAGLQAVLTELWRYKYIVPAVAAVVTGLVALKIMRETKIYEATATLEYDPNPARPLGKVLEDTSQGGGSWWDTQEFYETQNFILKSRSLSERVVRKLGLHSDPEFLGVPADKRKSFSDASVEATALRVLSRLEVKQVRDTRVVRISVRDASPDRAQLLANSIAEEYIEKSLEDRLDTSSRALDWLATQMQNLKRELESSELALYKFREENDSLSASLEERQGLITNQLLAYTESQTRIHIRRVETQARLSVLRELLEKASDPGALQAGLIAADPSIPALRERYREVAAQVQTLAVTYGPAHPLLRSQQAKANELHVQLQDHVRAIIGGVEADLRELERAEVGIQSALAEVNQQGLELSLQEIKYSGLDRERKGKVKLHDIVMERLAATDLTRALRVSNARIVDRAPRPSTAVSPRVQSSIVLGSFFGLVLGVAAAFGVAQLDNKVRGAADVESRGVTVLGVLPSVDESTLNKPVYGGRKRAASRLESEDRDMIVHLQPRSNIAECCRTIRTNITFKSADTKLRTIAVTSAMPRDGKTTVSISLAITLAQSGRKVMLVDTDLRKPRLHKAFKLPLSMGVTSILAGDASLDQAMQATDIPGLTLLQCGPLPPNPSELLHTRKFADLVEEAKGKFDTVIFDSPPLGPVTDPAIISTLVDGTILVVRARSTTRAGMDAAIRQLQDVSARLIGAVLNGVNLSDGDSYYASYRGYYAEENRGEAASPGPAARTGA